jgi:hypothetical protein
MGVFTTPTSKFWPFAFLINKNHALSIKVQGIALYFFQHRTNDFICFCYSVPCSFTWHWWGGLFFKKFLVTFFPWHISTLRKFCKWTFFAQQKTFFTSNDLLYMRDITQVGRYPSSSTDLTQANSPCLAKLAFLTALRIQLQLYSVF